eukprot:gene2779-2960_t
MAVPEIVEGDRKQRFLSRLPVVSIDLDDGAVFQFWYKYYTTLFDFPNEKTKKTFEVRKDCIKYENHTLRLPRDRKVIEFYVDEDTSKLFPLESDYKRLFTDHVRIISENVEDLTQIPRFYMKLLIESAIEKGHIKLSEQKAFFKDGWSVLWEEVIEKDATIYKHGMRLTYEMTLLKKATGYDMKQLIPGEVLVKMKSLCLKVKSIQDFIKESDSKFEKVRKEYEVYLDQCYFDDPLELNREPTLHAFIEKVRGVIRGRIASGKCQISPSQSRKIMRMLIVLSGFNFIRPLRMSWRWLLPELEYWDNDFERVAWVVVGGPAAGKSTLKRELKIQSPVCEINPDDYKPLLYDEGGPQNASLVHEESSFIADQIMKALKTMSKRPEVFLDVVKSSEDRMDILAEGGATLNLTIATCEAEEAINRAYNRATKSESSEDLGRYVPTKEILLGHKKESLILPAVIRKKYRINLDLFDTSNPREPILVAQLETKRKELKIYRLSLFLKFIRKALINEYATHKDQVYLYPFDGKAVYKELMKYIDEGVTLSFFNKGALYVKIDPSTGLTGLQDWFDLLSDEISRDFPYTLLEDLLLYFAYPHYCTGLLMEIPGKPINLLDIEFSDSTLIRNKESKMQIYAKDFLRNIFSKLFGSYPTIKLIEPTPLKEKEFTELIEMIRGKELIAEETNQLLSSALFALEAKSYKDLDRFLREMLSQQKFDYVNRIVARAVLTYRIFPVARLLPDSGSIWVSDTIKNIIKFEKWYKFTNVHFNRSLKLCRDSDEDKDRVALVECPENTNLSFRWHLVPVDGNPESFHIKIKIDDSEYCLKLAWKEEKGERILYGAPKIESTFIERYQWQLIPIKGENSFRIVNKLFKSSLRFDTEVGGGEDLEVHGTDVKRCKGGYAWKITLLETQQRPKPTLLSLFLDSIQYEDANLNFLRNLRTHFSELDYYAALCDATPDLGANIPQPNESLLPLFSFLTRKELQKLTSDRLFQVNKVLLRLIYLQRLMKNDRTYFPFLSSKRLNYISKSLILPWCKDEDTFTFLVLSIVWDALGRTKRIRRKVKHLNEDDGHDEYWRSFLNSYRNTKVFDKLIPSFKKLTQEYRELYYSNVATNTFNLGAFVQGESAPYCLYELLKDGKDCRIRLFVLLISFLPMQYNNKFEAVGFTNAMYDQFTTALTVISETKTTEGDTSHHLQNQSIQAYKKYLKLNSQMVKVPTNISNNEKEMLTLHRIVALSRSRFELYWRKIWFVWIRLASEVKKALIGYMSAGFDEEDGQSEKEFSVGDDPERYISIYIYYAPAIIANTITSAKRQYPLEQVDEQMFHEDAWVVGLYHSLIKLAEIYKGYVIPLENKNYYIYYGKKDADDARNMDYLDNKDLI